MELIVSCLAADADLLARMARGQVQHADAIELRLDGLATLPPAALAKLFAGLERPSLAAVHGAEAHGSFAGTDEERLALLARAATAGAERVDLTWKLAAHPAAQFGAARVLSRHELEGTPEDLAGTLAEMERGARAGDVLKLVPHARSAEDGVRVLRLVEERALAGKPIVAFASGTSGAFTRVLAPLYGSLATYAAPAAGTGGASAPGQIPADALRAAWPARGPGPQTRIHALIGSDPERSLSPPVHTAGLRAREIDAVYVACAPENLARFVGLLDERWRSLAVTMPFKREAALLATERDANVFASGAANTLVRVPRGWRAHNTDLIAVRELVIEALLARNASLSGVRVLVVGTGGAARAALAALRGAHLFVCGRDPAKSVALAAELGARALPPEEAARACCGVLVQTTPLGARHDDPFPVSPEAVTRGQIVLDAVYRPRETPLVRLARARGAHAIPGGAWFLRQALAQFRLTTLAEPPVEAMQAALDAALAEQPV